MELSPVSGDTSQRLAAAGLDPARIADIIGATVAEDLDGGVDITSVSTVPASQRSIVTFGARADGCLSGLDIACAVVEMVCGAGNVVIERLAADGDRLTKGDVIARVTAPTQRMLTAERTALNLMCHL
ncbi:MAG: nicotinate-nucleotide pyrophosphorylase [Actinomycetota bacterium]